MMKKFYSFALILLTLFSCVLFSACGDKYKRMTMDFYSAEGEVIEVAEFMIDNYSASKRTLGIEFSHIDAEDVGQVVVYSLPNELVTVSNYVYKDNMCYVDITPNMSSKNAKLVVSHLASGKKKEIDLVINQKSSDLKITNSTYVVSLPTDGEQITHTMDLSKVVGLLPYGSTDDVYFKLKSCDAGVTPIPLVDVKGFEDVYTGFEVSGSSDMQATIYPVTYMKGYETEDKDKYIDREITVLFRKTLNNDNVTLTSSEVADFDNIKLIVNDDKLNSFELVLNHVASGIKTPLVDTDYFDLYDIQLSSSDSTRISAFADGKNNIVLQANAQTDEKIKIDIVLKPKNVVGDIYPVVLTVMASGELKADKIVVTKNGDIIEEGEKTNIFDYYDEGNSLGAVFAFKPVANGGEVNEDLKKVQLVVSPEILSKQNCANATPPIGLCSKSYVLEIHIFFSYLKFTEDNGMMVSEPFEATDRIYIKYIDGDGSEISDEFQISVRTVNESSLEYWKGVEMPDFNVDFNRLEGVKSMSVEFGHYIASAGVGEYNIKKKNPEVVYLDRTKGFDNPDANVNRTFLHISNKEVLGVDGEGINTVDFEVKVNPLTAVDNPLAIYNGIVNKDTASIRENGTQFIEKHVYDGDKDNDVVVLIFRKDTSIGQYEITFLQEGVEKYKINVIIYEELSGLTSDMISLETNKTAFANIEYDEIYAEADYIVASGQDLNISVNLPQSVLISNIVAEYDFSNFEIGTETVKLPDSAAPDGFKKKNHFDTKHDYKTDNKAVLKFIKGTYIEDGNQYVYLTINIKTIKIKDNVEILPDYNENEIVIRFFIYEEILADDISINETNMQRYIQEYLGEYYKQDSQAELVISADESLWNYVTGDKDVEWIVDDKTGLTEIEDVDKHSYSLVFSEIRGKTNYTKTVKAYVRQFDKLFEFQCVFNVKKPIITERLIIKSDVKITDDAQEIYYINLKEGESYTLIAENYSSLGEVTNAEILIQVADEFGSAYKVQDYFDVNQTTSTIRVKKVDNLNNFQLIVFAKDALKETASSDKSGYNIPSTFLIDFTGSEQGKYLNAYFVLDIHLSNGTEANPYEIHTAKDFWSIDDAEEFKNEEVYWQLMTSIRLDSVKDATSTISMFDANLTTYNNNVYLIDGITLTSRNLNLFEGFSGVIKNVKFGVKYDYNITNDDDRYVYLGLFDYNNGELENVSVAVSGSATLNGNAEYYFGGLVAQNNGTIKFTKGIGVTGSLGNLSNPISGGAKVYLGGLVGKNVNVIEGCEEKVVVGGSNKIELNTTSGRADALSLIEINSSLSNYNTAIGGVIGLNTFDVNVGVIKNAFVQSKINALGTSNVGGVIGENNQSQSFIKVKLDHYVSVDDSVVNDFVTNTLSINNVKSASIITARNYVGGIVGLDLNGIYVECDYQIFNMLDKEPSIKGVNAVGGVAGKSTFGKFIFCSVMSYNWDYNKLHTGKEYSTAINDVPDISGVDYVGGIVGSTLSNVDMLIAGIVQVDNRVIIVSSSVNAYLQAVNGETLSSNIGGIHASSMGHAILYNVYFMGKLKGNVGYTTATTYNGGVGTIHYLSLDNGGHFNDNTSHYNAVYSVNVESVYGISSLKTAALINGQVFDINNNSSLHSFWWWNSNINGGYIFITTDEAGNANSVPIYDLAPDSISVTVKNPDAAGLERVLRLNYYDFSVNANVTDELLKKLDEKYNRNQYIYYINETTGNNDGLLNIVAQPENLGTVIVNVQSTNTSIIDVSYDGRLIINNVGECELIFSSPLNSNAGPIGDRTIKVIVDYPIGDDFDISTSPTDASRKVAGKTQNITKNSTKQYYVITSGSKGELQPNGTTIDYIYKTKTDTNLKIEITYPDVIDADNYVQISGLTGTQVGNVYTVHLDFKTPLSISVLQYLVTGEFDVIITPYTKVNSLVVYYKDLTTADPTDLIKTSFKLSTKEGVRNVAFSYDEAIVYPSDIVYLTMTMETDTEIDTTLLSSILNSGTFSVGTFNNKNALIKRLTANNLLLDIIKYNNDVKFNIYIDESAFNSILEVQTLTLRIEFEEMQLEFEELLHIQALVQLDDGSYETLSQVNYTIIPQRINKIEIKNYYYKTGSTELVQADILKPNFAGFVIIDIVPDNGYYDYLEISDITGNEEILFIQVDEDLKALSVDYDPSSDGKGIKLYHYTGQEKSRLYVRTQISNQYSSKIHTIQVRAYSADGSLLTSYNKLIDVKMLPSIEAYYTNPDGSVASVAGTNEGQVSNVSGLYLANGVNANFRIETKNANSEVWSVISATALDGSVDTTLASKYEFVNVANNLYELRVTNTDNIDDDDIGKKIKLTFTVYSYMDNGDYDMAECSVEFEIVSFVIHGISVNSSIDNLSTKEIYGYYDKSISLNFYFDEYDISYYKESKDYDAFWDRQYVYQSGIENTEEAEEDANIKQIYTILKELNSYDKDLKIDDGGTLIDNPHYGFNEYLILNNNMKETHSIEYNPTFAQGNVFNVPGNTQLMQLFENRLTIKEGYDKETGVYAGATFEFEVKKYLAVAFRVFYDGTKWSIEQYLGNSTAEESYIIDENYELNFNRATNWYEPTVVKNEEDFLNMESGGRYILAKNLVLENYSPIDANIVEFDGNGRTITIKSFAIFNETSLQAGLFKQIYEDMIVKNVVVEYKTSDEATGNWSFGHVESDKIIYTDLCNNPEVNYTQARFGGVAAINNGLITNCVVKGEIAVRASTLEQKTMQGGGNYEVDFSIGGMVAENSSTGYITNSSSELSIFAQANIGGFVHTNDGKIASCGVDRVTIYGYNINLGNTIIVEIAGFVVDNTNDISMSYVNLIKENRTFISPYVYYGTMSAKDISAGFAYFNSGKILEAYVYMTTTGINNNTFSGFVYSNSGSITRAYTYINGGSKVDNNDSMFAPAGTTGLTNCIELVVNKAGYSNGIDNGLYSEDIVNRNNKDCYAKYGFAFGDNESAVWMVEAGSTPKLVSTQEKVVYTGNPNDTMNGLLPFFEKVEEVDGVTKTTYTPNFGYYGTKNNPYIIYDAKDYKEFDNNGNLLNIYKSSWSTFFTDNTNAYYRIIKDIDFSENGDNPITSTMTFAGNIQGNNMVLNGVMLYSSSSLNSLGLFKNMQSANDYTIKNAVRNLNINVSSVWASSTQAVGVLAGIIEDFNIYNVTIDAEDVIMVAKNAVGGLAGVIRGEFDIDQISSNIGVNSTRASILSNYSIYMSENNGNGISANLSNVYYGGSVVGILDGCNRSVIGTNRDITKKYYKVRNISVVGNVVNLGDSVGGAFGLVGERVYVENVLVDIAGSLFGSQYSAGVAGENRGVISNAKVVLADELFAKAKHVSAGAVGLNLGGLVRNVSVTANINKTLYNEMVAGIVGRNIYGTITDVYFEGQLYGHFTGGIIGADYTDKTLKDATAGSGALSVECRTNGNLIPSSVVNYTDGNAIVHLTNLTLSASTLSYLVENSSKYYTYVNSDDDPGNLRAVTVRSKVLGLVVGLSYQDSIINKNVDGIYNITFDDKKNITFNATNPALTYVCSRHDGTQGTPDVADDIPLTATLKQGATPDNTVMFDFIDVNVLNMSAGKDYVIYLIGSTTLAFDSWSFYSNEYILVR